jgi:hypothetical protein
MSKPVGRPITADCGTMPAYKRALRRKKAGKTHCGPCDTCKAENARWQREYQAAKVGS